MVSFATSSTAVRCLRQLSTLENSGKSREKGLCCVSYRLNHIQTVRLTTNNYLASLIDQIYVRDPTGKLVLQPNISEIVI